MTANVENIVLGSNQPAWHGAGTVLPEDCLSWEQIITAVPELGMTVHKTPIYAIGPTGKPLLAGHYSAMVRDDDRVLGVNGANYEPVQSGQAFQFMSELLQRKEAVANTAGTLDGGRQMFICCLAPDSFYVGGEATEEHRGYVSFINSFDGSKPVGAITGATRIVCQNTYNAAIDSAKNAYWFKHTRNVMDYLGEARKALQVGADYWRELERIGNQAIRASFSDRQFVAVLDVCVPLPVDASTRKFANAEKERNQLEILWGQAPDIQNIRGTAWAAVNAFTAFSDHHIGSRETERNSVAANRTRRIMFDTSLKDKATAMIYEMAEIR